MRRDTYYGLVLEDFKLTEVKILSGSRSIGGNFVRIEDGDRVIVFDQGIRFDIMANYYSGFLMPQGLAELRRINVLPQSEWYEGVNGIYITHMHLDHLGALSNIPYETTVNLPSLKIYEDMEERWRISPSWFSLLPRKYYVELKEMKPLKVDENDVMAVPVSHSAHPAYALLYFGRNEIVLYTGDLRVESFLTKDEFLKLNKGEDLITYLQENPDIRIDDLVIEGTNIGLGITPMSSIDVTNMIKRLIIFHRPVIATSHGLDLEYVYTLLKIASELNLICYVASTQIAKLLDRIPEPPLRPILVEEYVKYPTMEEKVNIEGIETGSIILVSYWEVIDFLKRLSPIKGLIGDPVVVISEPEPEIEEASEYGVIANWLSNLGIQYYRIRVSGHYYPYQLKTLLAAIKPKRKIEVIHTLRPRLFQTQIERIIRL